MTKLKHLLILLFLFSCAKQTENYHPQFSDESIDVSTKKKEFTFGVHPLHNPERLQFLFGPVVDYLNKQIKTGKLKLEASNSYNEYNEKIKSKRLDFLLPNPYQTLIANKFNYKVISKMGNDELFVGIGLIRTDSKYTSVKQFEKKLITFPAPTALAAAMMPQLYLEKNGLNLKKVEIKYVGSQDSSIMAVLHNEAEMGVTWMMAWNSFVNDHPGIEKKLKILFKTKPLINNSVMARKDLDPKLMDEVREALITMHNNPEGIKILENLKLTKFEVADDHNYKIVENFLNEFKTTFGVLPE